MKNPGLSGLEQIRQESWPQSTFAHLRTYLTYPNLVGLVGAACALFLFFRLPEQWNARIPFYLVIFVWTVLRPRMALYLMPFAVPWGSVDNLNIAGLNLNSADLLVGFLALGWLLGFVLHSDRAAAGDREHAHVSRSLIAAIILLLATMFLSMRAALSIGLSLKEIGKWLEFLLLVLLGAQYIRTRSQVWVIAALVCLAGISQAAYGYIQAVFNIGPEAFFRSASLRVYGTFGQPNPYAGYINIPLSIALALMLLGGNWRTRILAACAVVLLGGAELLTQSRGGQIAIVGVVLFILIVGLPRLRKLLALLGLLCLVVVGLVVADWIPTYVLAPLFSKLGLVQISFTAPSADDYPTAERLAHWIAGLRMFIDHPLTGVGIGNYPAAYPHYYVTIFVNSLGHAHNYYINIAAETGAIGFTAFLLFLMAVFVVGGDAFQAINKQYRRARAKIRTQPAPLSAPGALSKLLPARLWQTLTYDQPAVLSRLSNDRALAIGLLAALISVCIHNLVDDLYVHSMTNLIALLLIALIRLATLTSSNETSHLNNAMCNLL
jgi:O-antigen ligase